MTERDLGTYQMLWDCPYCGTDKLLGLDHRHCPTCGAAQDEGTRYFPEEADRVAVEDHRYHGADLDCPSCSSPNAAIAKHCVNCGMALAEAAAVEKVDAAPKAETPPPKKKKGGMGCGTLFVVGLVLMGGYLLINTCTSKDAVVTVTARSWERTIQVEQLRAVDEGGWCDALPAGVKDPTRTQKVRSTDKVPDGETCVQKQRDNGDGTFTAYEDCTPKFRSVDVMGDWCTWPGTAWRLSRNAQASGTTEPPAWPDTGISKEGECLGCERESGRAERYEVTLEGAEASGTCDFAEGRWANFTVGSKWTTEASGLSGNVRCGTLRPKE